MPKPTHPRPLTPGERSKIRPVGSVIDSDTGSVSLDEAIQFAAKHRPDTVPSEGVERRLLEALFMEKPLVRAKATQQLLPVVESLMQMAYELRSDAVLAAWKSGGATYKGLARELGVSKSLIQIMVREARERSNDSEIDVR